METRAGYLLQGKNDLKGIAGFRYKECMNIFWTAW
jgi:hypothetical protein